MDQLRYVHRAASHQINDETSACAALQLLFMHKPVTPPGQDVFIEHIVAECITAERLLSKHYLLNAALTDQTPHAVSHNSVAATTGTTPAWSVFMLTTNNGQLKNENCESSGCQKSYVLV